MSHQTHRTIYFKSVYSIVRKEDLDKNKTKHEYQKDSWPKSFAPYSQRLGTRDEGMMGDKGGVVTKPHQRPLRHWSCSAL